MCACSTGVWKVVAFFPNSEQQRFYAEFEVKEYGEPNIITFICRNVNYISHGSDDLNEYVYSAA